MARYDKYDPKVGGFRAPLAADWPATDLERVYGVSLNNAGQVVKGLTATQGTGIIGVLVLTKARKAGEIVDVMTDGEIIEFANTTDVPGVDTGIAGAAYYASTTAVNEVQTLTGTATDGTFKLSLQLPGETTAVKSAALNHDATTVQIHDAVEGMSNVGSGQITAGGTGPLGSTTVTLTFTGTLAGTDVPLLKVVDSTLTGGDVTVAETTPGHSTLGQVKNDATTGGVYIGHTVEPSRLIVRVRPGPIA